MLGYPKSGSTFPQTQYFTKNHDFFNLTQEPIRNIFIENHLLSEQSSYYFSSPPEDFIQEKSKSYIVGLSTENFLDGMYLVDLKLTLKRWKTLYPTTKVLIVIRKQDHLMIYSNYIQCVRAGYYRSVDAYN